MKILAIYGHGGLGREVSELARCIQEKESRWQRTIFVDDLTQPNSLVDLDLLTFEEVQRKYSSDEIEFSIAVGEPAVRADLYESVSQRGYPLVALIHPSVTVPRDTSIGAGAIICQGCFISCGVVVGRNVLLQPNLSVGHDCNIGDHSVLSTFVSLAGACRVGARSYLGMSVPVKENTTIGDDVIVGMGSVVVRSIDSGVVALGNPARPMSVNDKKRVFQR